MREIAIRPIEHQILLMRMQGWSGEKIAEATGYTSGGVRNLTRYFEQKGLIEKTGKCQYRLIGTYILSETKRSKCSQVDLEAAGEMTPEVETKLRELYEAGAPRKVIARKLGLNKFELNMMILQLKLEGCG